MTPALSSPPETRHGPDLESVGTGDRNLRPWGEVAAMYIARTGRRMTENNAKACARKALIKMRGAMATAERD